MKKLLKFLLILVIIVAIIVGLPLFLIYSNVNVTNIDVNKVKDTKLELNNKIEESLENVKDTKQVDFVFTKEELEYLLYPLVMSLDLQGYGKITGAGIKVNNGEYTLAVSAEALKIKTVAHASLAFSENNGTFKVKATRVKVGKVDLTGIAKSILKNQNEEKLEKTLADNKIYCDIDLNEMSISISKANMINMIQDSIKDDNLYLFWLLVDLFIDNKELLKFNLGDNDLLGAYLYLSDLVYNEVLVNNPPLTQARTDLKKLLDNNAIDVSKASVSFNFIVNGYSPLKDEDKEIIDEIDFSSIGINNNKTYTGIMVKGTGSLNEAFASQFSPALIAEVMLSRQLGLRVTEETLETLLNNVKVVGTSYAFAHDQTHNVSSITIEYIDVEIEEKFLSINIIVDINGLPIYANASFDCEDATGVKIIGNLKTVSLGTRPLNETQNNLLFNYLDAVTKELDWMDINPENNTITLDFAKSLSENEDLNDLLSSFTSATSTTSLVDNEIVISYSFNL